MEFLELGLDYNEDRGELSDTIRSSSEGAGSIERTGGDKTEGVERWKVKDLEFQSINRLKRRSQLYPRTISQGLSREVTRNSFRRSSPEGKWRCN